MIINVIAIILLLGQHVSHIFTYSCPVDRHDTIRMREPMAKLPKFPKPVTSAIVVMTSHKK